MDSITQVQDKMAQLDTAIAEARESGKRAAANERDYQRAKNLRMAELKAEGYAVSYITACIKGDASVNDKLFQRDLAQTMHESDRDLVNVLKLEIRVLVNQTQRDYGYNQPL